MQRACESPHKAQYSAESICIDHGSTKLTNSVNPESLCSDENSSGFERRQRSREASTTLVVCKVVASLAAYMSCAKQPFRQA